MYSPPREAEDAAERARTTPCLHSAHGRLDGPRRWEEEVAFPVSHRTLEPLPPTVDCDGTDDRDDDYFPAVAPFASWWSTAAEDARCGSGGQPMAVRRVPGAPPQRRKTDTKGGGGREDWYTCVVPSGSHDRWEQASEGGWAAPSPSPSPLLPWAFSRLPPTGGQVRVSVGEGPPPPPPHLWGVVVGVGMHFDAGLG